LEGLLILVLAALSFGAGYLARSMVSRRRREEFRKWAPYTEAGFLPHANNNAPRAPEPTGDLGQMLSRWEERARSRKRAAN
jgi:hypothetical protein